MEAPKKDSSADARIIDRWRRLIEAKFAEHKSALREEVSQELEKFAAMGNAGSGGAYKRVRAVCDSEINRRADIVLQSLKEVHGALGSPITEPLAKKLKDEAGDYVEAIVKEVCEYMAQRLPMFEPLRQLFDFEDTQGELKKRIDVELDLYFDSVGEVKESAETGREIAPTKRRGIGAWFKTHPHTYGLAGSGILLIVFLGLGLLIPQWRVWCWGAVIPVVLLILSLLGGRPRP